MAEKNDKWLMFKQYMHNELGITKDDIRDWVRDAVKEEAKQLVKQTGFTPQDAIKQEVRSCIMDSNWSSKDFKYDIKQAAGKILAESIEMKIKQ